MGLNVRKGDTVAVMAGRDKGKTGKVLHVFPDGDRTRLVVEKINFVKKHMKPTQKQQQGGIVSIESTIHVSSVMIVCGKCGRPSKVFRKLLENGQKARVCKKCGEMVDKA